MRDCVSCVEQTQVCVYVYMWTSMLRDGKVLLLRATTNGLEGLHKCNFLFFHLHIAYRKRERMRTVSIHVLDSNTTHVCVQAKVQVRKEKELL